jgi:2-polyprenyl-6-methoxyphenol hydroxylase-like FAD-dependent oxidoreductase
MAGMLAARVLSDHFEWVTIVEKDHYPSSVATRAGVPQSRHLHALLLRGLQIVSRLFPGIDQELVAAGAVPVDVARDFAWYTSAGWAVNFDSGMEMLSFTRELLDWHIRQRVEALPNIQILDECGAMGLVEYSGSAKGILLEGCRGANIDAGEQLRADLVVDATGRRSRASEWLTTLGYPAPEETVVNSHLGYASRLYRRGKAAPVGPWKGLFIQAAPPARPRAGVMLAVEGDRWMATLGGGGRDYPPIDESGFLDFARSLPSSMFYNMIKDAEPLTPIYAYRATENRLRHYERLERQLECFVVLGDGACAFNPVYGQGMTAAALGAETLDETLRQQRHLRRDLIGLAARFQKRLAEVNQAPWMLASGEDYRYRGTVGPQPDRMTLFMHRYMDHVMKVSLTSVEVRKRFLEIQQMTRLPSSIFAPHVAMKVMWSALRQSLAFSPVASGTEIGELN